MLDVCGKHKTHQVSQMPQCEEIPLRINGSDTTGWLRMQALQPDY